MSQPTTAIGFSPTTPAAPSGYQNTVPQTDNGSPLQKVSEYVPNTGGVSAKTANYTAVAGDCGTLLSFNSSSAVTLTLPAAPPFGQWQIAVQNIGAGVLTINRNSLNIDGAAANLTINQNSGVDIYTDGTNYFTERGAGNGGGGSFVPETPSGTQNSINLVFTLAFAVSPANSYIWELNGVYQIPGVDISVSGNTGTFTVAPRSYDIQRVIYSH